MKDDNYSQFPETLACIAGIMTKEMAADGGDTCWFELHMYFI